VNLRDVVFDLDGTLVDSVPGIVACLTEAFAEVAPGFVLPDLASRVGPPVATMIDTVAARLPGADRGALLAAFRRRYDGEGWKDVREMDGATRVLGELSALGVRCTVATYKPLRPTRAILAHLGLDAYVHDVRCVDGPGGVFARKEEMILSLLAGRGLDTAIYVGDTPADVAAAREAGVAFFGVGGQLEPRRGLVDLLRPG
jgi:phosphoglycolate phosphatase